MGCSNGQIAVVTGASSGIGRAIALGLGQNGAEVCLVARRRDALQAVAEQVCKNRAHAHICCADVTSDEDLQALAQRVEQDFGRLDVLVLCGGAISHGRLERASLADFDLQYSSNVRAPYALTQLMLPLLRKAHGQIVFINSSAGLGSPANAGQFSATQHALRAIANSLRDEVNADGIRVLSVYPGRTATPRIAALCEEEGQSYRPELLMQPEDVATIVTHALTLPRTAEVTDISMRPMQKSY
jgi:NADP-dependent 3-hydroxy acid dehydrogenase YdfG